ncbi:sterol desaturase family protein [Acanthopleuribacter pedis]|uniref:Sterol desaturase family protein n=1 Tax=Acanthopleuribacter pedis TaxID=442870 RepID=A0A8J7U4E2_9BACT|nr:sterol desaturase family protein [Acanthopleuribacter pedis]MBO1319709.1 sterol desaturase family protein [Acanthopleuribacter pedis]
MNWQQLNLWQVASDPRGYFFWLLLISLLCLVLERLFPWRKQPLLRPQFGQDLFFLVFNGHYAGLIIAVFAGWLTARFDAATGLNLFAGLQKANLLAEAPAWLQFILFFLFKDFLEYCIHNLLHRVPVLWRWHKIHHSIETMDWIGNFRFHWLEIVLYKSLSYLPLVILGVDGAIMLWIAVIATLVGHLNHSNLNWSYGPLRFVFNSPRFHIWHHDVIAHGGHGTNFAIVFSIWDWLFGTAFWPKEEQPPKLGFADLDRFPTSLWGRMLYPFTRKP